MLRSFADCVRAGNLWLIHVGHSWSVYRIPSGDVQAVLGTIRPAFPKAAVFQEVREISDPAELRECACIADLGEGTVLQRLNVKPTTSGCDFVFGVQGWGA